MITPAQLAAARQVKGCSETPCLEVKHDTATLGLEFQCDDCLALLLAWWTEQIGPLITDLARETASIGSGDWVTPTYHDWPAIRAALEEPR